MLAWTIVQLVILLWAIRLLWRHLVANRNKSGLPEPPGPYGLPVVGYLPFLGKQPHVTFMKLGRRYGDIFQVQMGVQKAVVLNSLDVIKEAFVKDMAFAGRPETVTIKTFLDNSNATFSFRNGNAQWKYMRKLAINALSMFATSRNSRLEAVVDEASDEFHTEIMTRAVHGPFDPQRNIFDCVSTVVGRVLFGVDFSSKDGLLKNILELTEKLGDFFSTGSVADTLPFGTLIMRNKIQELIQDLQPFNTLLKKHITEHEVNWSEEDEVRDVADAIALAAKHTPEEVKQQLGLTDTKIRCIVQDLFGAGFGTTMESFRWAINLLAAFPDIQEKARRELIQICSHRSVTQTDRSDLPYNEAFCLEMFRYSSLLPLNLPHATMDDTTLRGYFIPKGTLIISNLYAHHYSSEHFTDPEAFNPERFLKSDGSVDMAAAQLVVPFSVGKRRCPGENLARQELSLLIGRFLQQFEVRQDPTDPIKIRDTNTGLTRIPVQTRLIFKKIDV